MNNAEKMVYVDEIIYYSSEIQQTIICLMRSFCLQ